MYIIEQTPLNPFWLISIWGYTLQHIGDYHKQGNPIKNYNNCVPVQCFSPIVQSISLPDSKKVDYNPAMSK